MTTYAAPVRTLLADPQAKPAELDALLSRETPAWLAWEVPTTFLEYDRGGAPVCEANQAKVRGLYALHLTGACFDDSAAFEAMAWLFSGVEAPGLVPHPVDLLRVFDVVRAVAGAHGEPEPPYAPDVLERVAELCWQAGYTVLPKSYGDVQERILRDLPDTGVDIEKKARQLLLSASSSAKHAASTPFPETPEGVAAARCAALELELKR